MPHDPRAILFDMRHALRGIGMFVEGKSLRDYESDLMLRSAVERQFEIVGEALGRLVKAAPELAARITEYQRIIGFRNVLIHGYDEINNETTWRIIQEKLPILRDEIEQLLGEAGAQ